jgi:hypothetical protein
VRTIVAVSLFALAACNADPLPPAPPALRPEVTRIQLPNMPDGHPDLPSLAVLSRGPRRMSVEQLERSIEQIGELPAGSVRFPESLALTLGRPDYGRVTEESLEPSPLFMKFMLDLGGIACKSLADLEPMRPVEQRVFTRYPELDQNLDFMLLRFIGMEGAEAEPYRARLREVHARGARSARGAIAGYEAACIALFTSPEFLLY